MISLSKGPEHEAAEDIHAGFKELLSAINKPRNTYSLKSANQLFEEETYPLLPVSWTFLLKNILSLKAIDNRGDQNFPNDSTAVLVRMWGQPYCASLTWTRGPPVSTSGQKLRRYMACCIVMLLRNPLWSPSDLQLRDFPNQRPHLFNRPWRAVCSWICRLAF